MIYHHTTMERLLDWVAIRAGRSRSSRDDSRTREVVHAQTAHRGAIMLRCLMAKAPVPPALALDSLYQSTVLARLLTGEYRWSPALARDFLLMEDRCLLNQNLDPGVMGDQGIGVNYPGFGVVDMHRVSPAATQLRYLYQYAGLARVYHLSHSHLLGGLLHRLIDNDISLTDYHNTDFQDWLHTQVVAAYVRHSRRELPAWVTTPHGVPTMVGTVVDEWFDGSPRSTQQRVAGVLQGQQYFYQD